MVLNDMSPYLFITTFELSPKFKTYWYFENSKTFLSFGLTTIIRKKKVLNNMSYDHHRIKIFKADSVILDLQWSHQISKHL